MSKIGKLINDAPVTVQTDSNQVQNNAGGFVYEVDQEVKLRRFLIIGVFGNTFYLNSTNQAIKALGNLKAFIAQDSNKFFEILKDVNESRAAKSNDFIIFALACLIGFGSEEARVAAYRYLPEVCRTSTHLFQLLEDLKAIGKGRGNGLKRAVRRWYQTKTPDNILYQVLKYRNREGWSHRDVLRLFRPVEKDQLKNAVFHYIVKNEWVGDSMPQTLQNFLAAQEIKPENLSALVTLIEETNIPWEFIPVQYLNERVVWIALLNKMGLTALLRNLGNMSKLGVFDTSDNIDKVIKSLELENITKQNIHPMTIFLALMQYSSGRGYKSASKWSVNPRITDALEDAFFASMNIIKPTNKKLLVALDTSGSMAVSAGIGGDVNCISAGSALVTLLYNVEQYAEIIGFTSAAYKADFVQKRRRLEDIKRDFQKHTGGTNFGSVLKYAIDQQKIYDGIIIFTDNETWQGQHATPLFKKYLNDINPNCKLIIASMVNNAYSAVDPKDEQVTQLIGLDSNIYSTIVDIIEDRI